MLDYDGDRGQFIADIPNTGKYCFELSDAEAVPEVVKFSSFGQFSNMRFDIVFCCEVLEHYHQRQSKKSFFQQFVRDVLLFFFRAE